MPHVTKRTYQVSDDLGQTLFKQAGRVKRLFGRAILAFFPRSKMGFDMVTPSPSLYSLHEGKFWFLAVFAWFCDCFRGFFGRMVERVSVATWTQRQHEG